MNHVVYITGPQPDKPDHLNDMGMADALKTDPERVPPERRPPLVQFRTYDIHTSTFEPYHFFRLLRGQ